MTDAEVTKLHFPCLVLHKPTGLVVKIEGISHGGDGIGTTKYQGNSEHEVGHRSNTWNMTAFSLMETNELYECKQ